MYAKVESVSSRVRLSRSLPAVVLPATCPASAGLRSASASSLAPRRIDIGDPHSTLRRFVAFMRESTRVSHISMTCTNLEVLCTSGALAHDRSDESHDPPHSSHHAPRRTVQAVEAFPKNSRYRQSAAD